MPTTYRTPTPIVTDDHRKLVYAVLAGIPAETTPRKPTADPQLDPTWEGVHRRAAQLLESTRPRLAFEGKNQRHRRGNFSALAFGLSHGGGQKEPSVLKQRKENEAILKELLQSKDLARFSGFATGMLPLCPLVSNAS